MVFYTGNLQNGIATAVQQSKLVVCFVTDDQEESKLWESEYLIDETIAPLFEKDAILLRLEAGSEEAGFLAALFPLPKNPTLVIIREGKLKEYLSTGTTKDEFLSRVTKAFAAPSAPHAHATSSAASATPATSTDTPASTPATAEQPGPNPLSDLPPPSGATLASTIPEQSQGPTQTQLLAEAEHRRQLAREKLEQERRRKEKGKMPAAATGQADAVKKKASQQLVERQRKARSERQRAERQASVLDGGVVGDGEPMTAATESVRAPASPVARQHDQCAIQVRLFDGSSIRTRFPARAATVSHDVRKWIDENRTDGKDPYTLKVILTPMPNRAIDNATEEDQTLQELGLAPSATLVLTPVDRYSSAYTNMNAGLTNPVSRLITAVLAIVMNILGGIATALGGIGERGRTEGATGEGAQNGESSQAAASGRDASGRIQGFQNPEDAKRDHQLYNGNSLNFEPRKDDEDKDK